jgi:hypothetical protein
MSDRIKFIKIELDAEKYVRTGKPPAPEHVFWSRHFCDESTELCAAELAEGGNRRKKKTRPFGGSVGLLRTA